MRSRRMDRTSAPTANRIRRSNAVTWRQQAMLMSLLRASIFLKLGVKTRAELVDHATEAGLI